MRFSNSGEDLIESKTSVTTMKMNRCVLFRSSNNTQRSLPRSRSFTVHSNVVSRVYCQCGGCRKPRSEDTFNKYLRCDCPNF